MRKTGWNTLGIANGPHVLRMEVTAGVNVTGHEIRVEVYNAPPPPAGGDSGSGGCGRCGATGLELALLGGLIVLWRRRSASF